MKCGGRIILLYLAQSKDGVLTALYWEMTWVVSDSWLFSKSYFIETRDLQRYSVSHKTRFYLAQGYGTQAGSIAWEYIIATFVTQPPILFYQKMNFTLQDLVMVSVSKPTNLQSRMTRGNSVNLVKHIQANSSN